MGKSIHSQILGEGVPVDFGIELERVAHQMQDARLHHGKRSGVLDRPGDAFEAFAGDDAHIGGTAVLVYRGF